MEMLKANGFAELSVDEIQEVDGGMAYAWLGIMLGGLVIKRVFR